jgi:hypothetical protein
MKRRAHLPGGACAELLQHRLGERGRADEDLGVLVLEARARDLRAARRIERKQRTDMTCATHPRHDAKEGTWVELEVLTLQLAAHEHAGCDALAPAGQRGPPVDGLQRRLAELPLLGEEALDAVLAEHGNHGLGLGPVDGGELVGLHALSVLRPVALRRSLLLLRSARGQSVTGCTGARAARTGTPGLPKSCDPCDSARQGEHQPPALRGDAQRSLRAGSGRSS